MIQQARKAGAGWPHPLGLAAIQVTHGEARRVWVVVVGGGGRAERRGRRNAAVMPNPWFPVVSAWWSLWRRVLMRRVSVAWAVHEVPAP